MTYSEAGDSNHHSIAQFDIPRWIHKRAHPGRSPCHNNRSRHEHFPSSMVCNDFNDLSNHITGACILPLTLIVRENPYKNPGDLGKPRKI